jgi:predicted nuclease of predicted toxin-antitoxin system
LRFKLDENLPAELTADLKLLGHEADTVADEGLAGSSDADVAAAALHEGRILLTLDKGFSRADGSTPGIVLFRLDAYGRKHVLAFIRARLPELLAFDLTGCLAVVSSRRIRLR